VLSPDEQRRLAVIEQHLGEEDPRLARLLVPGFHRTSRVSAWVLPGLIIVSSALCVLAGLVTAEPTALFGGLVILTPSLWLLIRRRRRPDPG